MRRDVAVKSAALLCHLQFSDFVKCLFYWHMTLKAKLLCIRARNWISGWRIVFLGHSTSLNLESSIWNDGWIEIALYVRSRLLFSTGMQHF